MSEITEWLMSYEDTDVNYRNIIQSRSTLDVYKLYFDTQHGARDIDLMITAMYKDQIEKYEFLRDNMPDLIKDDPEMIVIERSLQYYYDRNDKVVGRVLVIPGTYHYYVHHLFRSLVDEMMNSNMTYKLYHMDYSPETVNIISPQFKKHFYKFCYDNTYKKK